MSLANLFLKLSQLLVLFYVTIAVLYTTHYLLLSPILDVFFPSLSLLSVPAWLGSSHLAAVTIGEGENLAQHPVDASGALWPVDVSAANSPLYFPSTALAQELGMANAARTPINEATFLAKAFASALHPTRIIPFYYRSTGLVEDDDVTITTLVTANRFKVFKELVERYQGQCISLVAIIGGYMRMKQVQYPLRFIYHSLRTPLLPRFLSRTRQ